ncbi:hypothetical protein [Nibricoccus sp. IMCC34717]|uniref:hypothetical protein n=1 Tax=Nibricoccus sp. IMCC34717 TaxID=3034021 RepID=UPI00384C780F
MPIDVALQGRLTPETIRYGAGFNWFDHLGAGGYYAGSTAYPLHEQVTPALDDPASWSAFEAELSRLSPSLIRFGLPPDPHCDAKGRFQGGTVHLERLRRACRWASAHRCSVILDTFVLPAFHALPREGVAPDAMFQYAARSNRAYARDFVAPLLLAICSDPDFSAIHWFNPVNEPMCYGIYSTHPSQGDLWAYYVDMYRELREALDAAGVPRTRLGLIGLDHTSPNPSTMVEQMARTPSLDPYVDAYTIHYYYLRFDHLPPRPKIAPSAPIEDMIERQTQTVINACRRIGKPLLAAEIGTFYNGWRHGDPAGVASFHTCLTVAEAIVRGVPLGLDGFAFWCLLNPNTIDGHFAIVRVANGKAEQLGWPARVYGTVCRALRPGSQVIAFRAASHSADVPHVHAVALRHVDGARTVLVINDHASEEAQVSLELPREFGPLPPQVRWLNEAGASGTRSDSALRIPPMTFAVLSDSVDAP